MLTVWLIRAFVADLVDHMARIRGGDTAVPLDPDLRRALGIGNATGLGMAPFLVNHADLLNNWITARETAIARVRALPRAPMAARDAFLSALAKVGHAATSWHSTDPVQAQKWNDLRRDLAHLSDHVSSGALDGADPWDALIRWSEHTLSLEGQELCAALILEPFGDLVDDLADTMGADETATFRIDGAMRLSVLRRQLLDGFSWALRPDFSSQEATARFWYVSEAKLEPRLGERAKEPGADLEQPLDIARAAAALLEELSQQDPDRSVADFLLNHPMHRRIVRRVQALAHGPYREIRDNLIDAQMRPVDMLRCKLAFFGATNFDARSDRWLQITMYRGAPYPDELHQGAVDDWLHDSGAASPEAAE